jgi:hypothetical protein
VVDGDREPPGSCLRQTSAQIGVGLAGQLGLVLARGSHPPCEPLRGKLGLQSTKAPWARAEEDLNPPPAELLDGERDRIRAEEAASIRRAALVGVKCDG